MNGEFWGTQQTRPHAVVVASPVKGSIRLFHSAIGMLGMVMMIYATVLFVSYHRTGLIDQKPAVPWSLGLMGGIGMFMFGSAVAGCIATRTSYVAARRGIQLLTVSVVLLVSTICIQSAMVIFIFSKDAEWKHNLPDDPSGFWILFSEFLSTHQKVAKLTSAALLCTEFLGLALTLWLRSLYQEAYDEWLFDVEDQREQERRALGDAAQHAYEGGVPSVWNTRARTKYGMHSGRLREETQIVHTVVTPLLTDEE